jgi:hypothetical protein
MHSWLVNRRRKSFVISLNFLFRLMQFWLCCSRLDTSLLSPVLPASKWFFLNSPLSLKIPELPPDLMKPPVKLRTPKLSSCLHEPSRSRILTGKDTCIFWKVTDDNPFPQRFHHVSIIEPLQKCEKIHEVDLPFVCGIVRLLFISKYLWLSARIRFL